LNRKEVKMKKFKIELKYKVPIMVIAIVTLVAIVAAIVPPPPVNQNIGVYDTTITQFNQSLCRNCHNSTFLGGVPTRHHSMVSAQTIDPLTGAPFGCLDCHPIVNGELVLDRNCIDCHNGSAFWGNSVGANVPAAKPHHVDTSKDTLKIGQPAQNRTCNFCHGSFVANFNDGHYKPSYNTSFMITPYATFKATNATTGKEWGGCNACHQPNSGITPIIADNNINHHTEVRDATPGAQCSWCHVISPFFITITDAGTGQTITTAMEVRNSTTEQLDYATGAVEPGTTNISISGTGCEKCHSVQSIHNIQFNYTATNGQLGYGHIGTNWDCNGCHASWVAGAAPMQGSIIPSLDSINPSVLTAGVASTLTITGMNFVNDAYTSKVSVDGVTYDPSSTTDNQIVVSIPALTAGVHRIQLVKGDVLSKLATLTVVSNPIITSATLRNGVLTISGSGFGKPIKAQQYLIVAHAGKIFSSQANTWGDTQIKTKADSRIAAVGDEVTVTTGSGKASATIVKGK
jgi:hypothetical protein